MKHYLFYLLDYERYPLEAVSFHGSFPLIGLGEYHLSVFACSTFFSPGIEMTSAVVWFTAKCFMIGVYLSTSKKRIVS